MTYLMRISSKMLLGFGYDDEGFSFSVTFSEERNRFEGTPFNRNIFFRFNLRTLIDSGLSFAINTDPEPNEREDYSILRTFFDNFYF